MKNKNYWKFMVIILSIAVVGILAFQTIQEKKSKLDQEQELLNEVKEVNSLIETTMSKIETNQKFQMCNLENGKCINLIKRENKAYLTP